MDRSAVKTDDMSVNFGQWCFHETAAMEHKKQALQREKRELERERRKLEREKREFSAVKNVEEQRMEKEKQLFEMKWKILEEELVKLANEKSQVEKQRRFYDYVAQHEAEPVASSDVKVVRGDMFFIGVENEQSLKKRYKDLLKIYHPDNLAGDTNTIQEINREYDRLQKMYH